MHPILPPLDTVNLVMATVAATSAQDQGALFTWALPHSPSSACHDHMASAVRVTAELGISTGANSSGMMNHHSHSWDQKRTPSKSRANQNKGGGTQDNPDRNSILLS